MARGPRQLAVTFGAKNLTHYGGVYLLHRLLSCIGFKRALAQHIRIIQRNNRYSAGEMLLAILYPMILGLERLETTRLLRQNGVIQYLTGLPSYPDATSLRRLLLRAAPQMLPRLRALHDQFLQRMTNRPQPPARLIFDVDSTVARALWKTGRSAHRLQSNQTRASVLSSICCASKDKPKITGTGNCGREIHTPPVACGLCFRPASPNAPTPARA